MSQFHQTPRYVHRPTDALLPWLNSLLGAAIGLYPLRVIVTAWVMREHPQLATMGPTSELPSHLMRPAMSVGCVTCIELIVWIAWYVLLLVWAYRTAVNVRALDRRATEFSPAVCVVGLLPIVNLVMSPVVMSDLVLAAEGRATRGMRVSKWALAWWSCLVTAALVGLGAGVVTNPALLGQAQLALPLAIVQAALGEAYLVLTLLLVRRVQRAMDGRVTAYHAAAYGRTPEPWE